MIHHDDGLRMTVAFISCLHPQMGIVFSLVDSIVVQASAAVATAATEASATSKDSTSMTWLPLKETLSHTKSYSLFVLE